MFRLTCIELDNGEFAVYINHHYLGSEDASGERLSLGEVLEQLSLLPGVELQTLLEPVAGLARQQNAPHARFIPSRDGT